MFPASGCGDCRYLVNDDVLQRNDELTVRHGRSSEPPVQQALWHQFLDCEHLLLVPDLAKSVLKFGHFIRERPQDVITSFALSLSVMLLISAAYAELLSDVFL